MQNKSIGETSRFHLRKVNENLQLDERMGHGTGTDM